MAHGPRRALLALVCALTGCTVLPTAAGAVVVGIGDQVPTFFTDPHFVALHIKEARLTVSWNVAVAQSRHHELLQEETWLNAAAAAGVTPLVSFSGIGNYIPSVSKYTHAVEAFIQRFPAVKRYTAWNEPDWIYRKLGKQPRKAAAFFNALAHHCNQCTLLAGDLYLPAKQLKPWLRAYKKALRVRPSGWALHNYNDVRTHTTHQLKVMLKLTSGPIWLDEISGVEHRGHWQYRNQSPAAAGRDEKFLFSLPHRFPRISHIYHYLWQAATGVGWDSGLIAADGNLRPAYLVVQSAAATG